jgi:hypothetical protein
MMQVIKEKSGRGDVLRASLSLQSFKRNGVAVQKHMRQG